MTRPIAEYGLADWARLRPLTQAVKTLRYRLINESHMRRSPLAGDLRQVAGMVRGRNVLVTIAFNDAEAAAWQIDLVRKYVPGAVHIIADNSSDDAAAAKVAAVTAAKGVPYIRLPQIKWRRGVTSRSHGLALNWVWRNILKPGEPQAFGFLDDDIFPTAPDDPFAFLKTQDFFGLVRHAGKRWFLWAGFCFFRFDAVRDKPLDFGQDWFIGLDTGGGNWRVLYQNADLKKLRRPSTSFFPYREGASRADGQMQSVEKWLHEVGQEQDLTVAADKRRVLQDMLFPHLAAGAREVEENR